MSAVPAIQPPKASCWCPCQTDEIVFNTFKYPSGESWSKPPKPSLPLSLWDPEATPFPSCREMTQLGIQGAGLWSSSSPGCLVHMPVLHWPLHQGWDQSLEQDSLWPDDDGWESDGPLYLRVVYPVSSVPTPIFCFLRKSGDHTPTVDRNVSREELWISILSHQQPSKAGVH